MESFSIRSLSKLDEYKDETVEVNFDYPELSQHCIKEKAKGAKFYWSDKYTLGYEKYFEISGNARRYFKCRTLTLWIKRLKASNLKS